MKISRSHKIVLSAIVMLVVVMVYRERDFLIRLGSDKISATSVFSAETTNRVANNKNKSGEPVQNQSGILVASPLRKGDLASFALGGVDLGKSTVGEMLSSDNIVLVDYALNRLSRICSGWRDINGGETLTNYISAVIARDQGVKLELDKFSGKGTKAQRIGAAQKMLAICRERLPQGSLNRSEMDAAFVALESLGFPFRDWMKARSNGGRGSAMVNEGTTELGKKILKFHLLGEISNTMQEVQSNESLQVYGADNVSALQYLAADYILMCRIGEDCSPGSLASNRFCAEAGYCGGHVEETLMNHFHKAGLDWAPFEKYVASLQNAILTGNVSIFRKPPPLQTSPPKKP